MIISNLKMLLNCLVTLWPSAGGMQASLSFLILVVMNMMVFAYGLIARLTNGSAVATQFVEWLFVH